MTYPNLRAEMARRGVKGYELADMLGIRQATFSEKLNGRSDFSLNELRLIKSYLGSVLPLETLFAKGDA